MVIKNECPKIGGAYVGSKLERRREKTISKHTVDSRTLVLARSSMFSSSLPQRSIPSNNSYPTVSSLLFSCLEHAVVWCRVVCPILIPCCPKGNKGESHNQKKREKRYTATYRTLSVRFVLTARRKALGFDTVAFK